MKAVRKHVVQAETLLTGILASSNAHLAGPESPGGRQVAKTLQGQQGSGLSS